MTFPGPDIRLLRSLLNNTFEVLRADYVHDGQGGSTRNEGVVATINGRLRPSTPDDIMTGGKLAATMSHVLYVEAPQELLADDVIMLQGRPERYRILEIREPSYAGFHLQVHLEKEINGPI